MRFSIFAIAASLSLSALATPLATVRGGRPEDSVHSRRANSFSASRLIIYTDDYIKSGTNGLPTAKMLEGYNVVIHSFLLASGPADQVAAFKQLSSSDRTALKKSYNDAGITMMLSSFGSTDQPTSQGKSATGLAATHAAFVKQYGYQGIDVDYEDMSAMNKQNGKAEQWLIDYTNALRKALPSGQYIITHAPVAPWFSSSYKSGAYLTVDKEAGDAIDWYNLQFYNQGDKQYTTCENLITKSGGSFPGTSIKEIHTEGGVPYDKLVIGKPSAGFQAENGYVDFDTLAECIAQAGKLGWSAGTMFWEYETDLSKTNLLSKMTTALSAIATGNDGGNPLSISVSSEPSTETATESSTKKGSKTSTSVASEPTDCESETISSTTVTKDTTPTSTVTSTSAKHSPTTSTDPTTGASCSGVKAWDESAIYTGGSDVDNDVTYVSYEGFMYANKWWTQGDKPTEGGDADPWTKIKACSSSSKRATLVVDRGVPRNASRRGHANKMRRVHVARSNDLS